MKNFDEAEWAKTKSLLREHLTEAPFEHPALVKIERQRKRVAPGMLPLRWLAWSGVFALFVAALLTMVVLPQQAGWPSDADFVSEVISAHAELPQLSVTDFRAPDQRGIVIWIEGNDDIPTEGTAR
jgi:hypothetical protein